MIQQYPDDQDNMSHTLLLHVHSPVPDLSITLVPSTGPLPAGYPCCAPCFFRIWPPVPCVEWMASLPSFPLYTVAAQPDTRSLNIFGMPSLDATYPPLFTHTPALSYITPGLFAANIDAINAAARDTPGQRHRYYSLLLLFLITFITFPFSLALVGQFNLPMLAYILMPSVSFGLELFVTGPLMVWYRRRVWQTVVQRVCRAIQEANDELRVEYARAKAQGSMTLPAMGLAQWRWVTPKEKGDKDSVYTLCLVDSTAVSGQPVNA